MVIVWNVITVIKIHRQGGENEARGDSSSVPNLSVICEEQQGVRGQLWPEVIGKSRNSGRWRACVDVCGCVLPYSGTTTSGTSEQSGGCCQGHRSRRSTPPSPPVLSPSPHSPMSTSRLLQCQHMQDHDWVLLAADRWAFTWNRSLRQERSCERLCCVEVVLGTGRRGMEDEES